MSVHTTWPFKRGSLFFLILLSFLSAPFIQAQTLKGKEASLRVSGAEVVRFGNFSSVPVFIKYRSGENPSLNQFLSQIDHILKTEPGVKLILDDTQEDLYRFTHYRYHMEYAGLPLEFSRWYVHVKEGKVVSANGFLLPSVHKPGAAQIAPQQAIDLVLSQLPESRFKWESPEAEQQ